ncbi:MAG: hypothetical protein Q7R43_01510 [Candidatus Daviesbacteria bacterium]|nr:hypothetical protein [Candidatus Daviesbacteria bacterium]
MDTKTELPFPPFDIEDNSPEIPDFLPPPLDEYSVPPPLFPGDKERYDQTVATQQERSTEYAQKELARTRFQSYVRELPTVAIRNELETAYYALHAIFGIRLDEEYVAHLEVLKHSNQYPNLCGSWDTFDRKLILYWDNIQSATAMDDPLCRASYGDWRSVFRHEIGHAYHQMNSPRIGVPCLINTIAKEGFAVYIAARLNQHVTSQPVPGVSDLSEFLDPSYLLFQSSLDYSYPTPEIAIKDAAMLEYIFRRYGFSKMREITTRLLPMDKDNKNYQHFGQEVKKLLGIDLKELSNNAATFYRKQPVFKKGLLPRLPFRR